MSKILRIIGIALLGYLVVLAIYYTGQYSKVMNTKNNATTTETNAVQQALGSGANANNQPDIARYKQQFVSSCIASVPNSSKGMQDYCKCMGDKVIDTYGVYKTADMGLSMNQEELETELTPLAVKCIEELGIKL